jgi:hypothetical protein
LEKNDNPQKARAEVEACLSKIAYETFEEAVVVQAQQFSISGKDLVVYLCERCVCYHLTSNINFLVTKH